jgi:hypothetical protein
MALESLLQLADAVAAALFRATPRRQENKEKENKDAGACVGVGDVVKYKTDESCQDTDEGTQFTCFTGTNAQILAQLRLKYKTHESCQDTDEGLTTQFPCFTSTNVQILTPEDLHPSGIVTDDLGFERMCVHSTISRVSYDVERRYTLVA